MCEFYKISAAITWPLFHYDMMLPIGLLYCISTKLTGEELEERVELRQNVTLKCSTDKPAGSHAFWIQLCSNKTSQFITQDHKHERFGFTRIKTDECYDLVIYNIAESEACVYYNVMVQNKTTQPVYTFGKNSSKVMIKGKTPTQVPCYI